MKHIKTFEGRTIDEDSVAGLQIFYKKFEEEKASKFHYRILEHAKNYKVPEEFNDEFALLYYLYKDRLWWATNDKKVDAYIKKEIKKNAIKSIIEKLKDEKVFLKLEKLLDSRPNFNDQGSRGYIHNGTIQYIFYSLKNAIEHSAEYELRQLSKKYNL